MTHLFLCSIGPVQELIATARRSRDLQYGSWMLSELAKAGARALADAYGVENLIFPAPPSLADLAPDSSLNVANKILVEIEGNPAEAGKAVKAAVRQRLDELRDDAFRRARGKHFQQDPAERQVADLLEFYWAAVRYDKAKPDAYRIAREQVEAVLAARKNTRDFQQFRGEMVPKSSLDASRESVIDEKAYPAPGDDDERAKNKIKMLFARYGARRGERLSGVDLMKRLGGGQRPFSSTSELAARPFMAGLDDTKGRDLLGTLERWVHERYPGVDEKGSALLYPNRVAEFASDKDAQAYQQFLEDALKQYAAGKHPAPYYALLVADGDGMGKRLDKMTSPDEHRRFSQALSGFSEQAKQVIREHQGVPIYVGGDDIMAYLPLHTALECLRDLRREFGKLGETFTLSGGLVIAHHLQPLSETLTLARSAEKDAKSLSGKKALCIVSNKRSGAERRITAHWNDLLGRLEIMANWHRQKLVSKGTAYELQDLHRRLDEAGLPREALTQEAKRIIKRKKESGGDADLPKEVREQLDAWLEKEEIPVGQLALEMIVAAEFAAAQELANIPIDEKKEAQV